MTCELFAEGDSLIHKLDPRLKVAGAILFSVFLIFIHHPPALCAALAGSVTLAALAKLDKRLLLKRLFIINLFIVFVCVFLPWSVAGPPVLLPLLPNPSTKGLQMAVLLFLKSNSMVLFNIGLLSTSSIFAINHAMAHMKFPPKLINLFFFSWRYLHVLEEEFHKMRRAALARGFVSRSSLLTYKVYANILGGLFVRSMDRGERVYRAMICRGFNGSFPLLSHFHFHRRDIGAALAFGTFLIILAGMEWLVKNH